MKSIILNYNNGFLAVTDRPYKELTDASKDTFKRLINVHSGKEAPVIRQAITK
jgi:hypothetical protein